MWTWWVADHLKCNNVSVNMRIYDCDCADVHTGFHIHVWQTSNPPLFFVRPPSFTVSLPPSLCSRSVEVCTECETCDWVITRPAGLNQQTNSLLTTQPLSSVLQGWLSVSSTRTPNCLNIIRWCSDAMISLGDQNSAEWWKYSGQGILFEKGSVRPGMTGKQERKKNKI